MKNPNPRASDDDKASVWRGPLFEDFHSPIMWKDKYYQMLEPPCSVTFPICYGCGRVIWDWPHFEEPVAPNCICDQCFHDIDEEA